MPLQNRVTPFGDIIAVENRGSVMGNRGIIHNPSTKTLLKKRWSSRAWIICVCQFKNVRRNVMARRSWTELFFLDEATALSAGHRPCFYCQRQRAKEFQAAWADGNGIALQSAPAMDAVLHSERLDKDGLKKCHPIDAPVTALPDGTMLSDRTDAYLIKDGTPFRWSWEGYTPARIDASAATALTPPSTIRALRAGYKPFIA
ncbi:hypothetical protein [Phyllobacterium sp. YR531]|uniref:hypothetical protein n=1 Tax=Phyllobacterium sp. YR531 TaxID=1144343 RepID=UPI00026F5B85|nr:hypothetical protein [Phyllobacterium sp. YR531]EJN03176.1 hypothetical protein PMI41_02723 [Phyllobacterium sp. YR531]